MPEQVHAFVDALKLFKIGWSWGGVTSLAMVYPGLARLDAAHRGRLVRLNIGLEEPADLIADLEAALAVLR
jgi:cystathionine beta-lyase